ncbi:MAG: S8 family serine peptidase [Verrucomicrobiaceae bacterium]
MKQLLFFLILLMCSSACGLMEDGPLIISDRGREGRYRVALDELEHYPADGGVARRYKLEEQGSAGELAGEIERLEENGGGRYDLVVYPFGEKRGKWNRRVLTRKVLVAYAEGVDLEAVRVRVGADGVEVPGYAPGWAIFDFEEAGEVLEGLGLLRGEAGVVSADPLLGRKFEKKFVPNDPRYAYGAGNNRYQWHLKNTGQNGGVAGIDANLESVWDFYKGAGIRIAIVDDGLEVTHPDLAANVDTAIDHDWNDGTPDDPTPTTAFDDHGTSVAGVAAARGNNGIGVSGVAPEATLVGLRLISGSPTDIDEAEAMGWRNDVIQVKNNSWGPPDSQSTLDGSGPLFKAALKHSVETGRGGLGTLHFWAAGNGYSGDNVNFDGYANSIYTIAIGAVDDQGRRADYSEPGAAKVVSTPSDGGGQGVTTTTLTQGGTYTDFFGGTSSATPLASGVGALMLEANPNLGWRDVQEVLIRSAKRINPGQSGWVTNGAGLAFHHDYGAGLIDAQAAVDQAATWTNLPAQEVLAPAAQVVNLAIPDGVATGIVSSFNLSALSPLRVEHVTVTVKISHPNRGQLKVSLISPSGTESFLAMPHTGAGANFDNWTMMTVHNWGETSQGIWTLKVVDGTGGSTGVLQNASIKVYGSTTAPISDPPVFSHAGTASGNVGEVFNFPVRATNAPTSYVATGLPPGLTLDGLTGLIRGTPSGEGVFNVGLEASNAIGTTMGSVEITIGARIPKPPEIEVAGVISVIRDRPFSYQISATNAPTGYGAAPLPEGLVLNAATGRITGTPTVAGVTTTTLTVSNLDGSDSAEVLFRVLSPGVDPLGQGLDNEDFVFENTGDVLWALQSTEFVNDGDALVTGVVDDGEDAVFSMEVTGPGFLQFWWKVSSEENYDVLEVLVDGQQQASISGEVDWIRRSVAVPAGSHVVSWSYSKDGSDDDGSDEGWVDQLEFTPGEVFRPLGQALDYPGLNWKTKGKWVGQILETQDGEDAAQSPDVANNGDATLSVDLVGPGSFSFYYRCESEEDYDLFIVQLDNAEILSTSGQVEWTRRTIEIPAGSHSLSWAYRKDDSVSAGADGVWIDQVVWEPEGISGFSQWRNLNFSPDEQLEGGVGGRDGDPDGDGRENLMEYALGSDPWVAGSDNEPVLTELATAVVFDFSVDSGKDDLVYVAEVSGDLAGWVPVSSSLVSVVGPVEQRRVVRLLGAGREFLRLRVSLEGE